MEEQSMEVSMADNKLLRISLQLDVLTVEIENPDQLEIYRCAFLYQQLPNQFQAIFDTLQEFYQFAAQANLLIENSALVVPAVVVGKTKMLKLQLEKVELTGEWRLKKDILELEAKLAQKDAHYDAILREKEETIVNLSLKLDQQMELIKERESQNLKLANRIRHLENTIDDLINDKARSENNQQESKLTEEYTPAKKVHTIKSKKTREIEEYGKKLHFRIDEKAKYYSKFLINSNEVEKLHGPTYQLFHTEPMPKEGKFYFDIKLISIRNNNFVVGLITDKNKEEQFSFRRNNSICYNGYDGSICEQERQSYVTIKPKEGNKLRTVVDMTLGQVQWYIMGGELLRTFIGKATIPTTMAKQMLYPFFELYWEGNKVKLNG